MNRLTYRYADGKAYVHSNVKFGFQECTDRLAAYEDTGLTPEEVNEMKAVFEYIRLRLDESDGRRKPKEEV